MQPAALADARWEAGWCAAAQRVPSPNHDERPTGTAVELVVVHNISLPPHQFDGDHVAELFLNRLDPAAHPFFATLAGVRVSAHFLVRRDGRLVQFVSCDRRAWHAGASRWRGRERCNDFSIGIELEGSDLIPFRESQYAVLVDLLRALRAQYPIGDITGHSEIAPGRKTDPGPFFDWARVHDALGGC
ncbi:MAG: 1,6-anhydro-N-acetylmuramyl-L-alanine amidase AmpD [Burkholderiales bacterium]|nr:1,6-anhydro-N-acetylmuramyl-L-alanine amidase AmpD [Burkholderiales bacterium]